MAMSAAGLPDRRQARRRMLAASVRALLTWASTVLHVSEIAEAPQESTEPAELGDPAVPAWFMKCGHVDSVTGKPRRGELWPRSRKVGRCYLWMAERSIWPIPRESLCKPATAPNGGSGAANARKACSGA
jgi:hypothetical protein